MDKIIDFLNISLQRHKYSFCTDCINLAQELFFNPYSKIALLQRSYYTHNMNIDYGQIPNIINRTIDESNNFVYQKRKIFFDYSFISNEIKVVISNQHQIASPDDDNSFIQLKLRENLNCFNLFLSSQEIASLENLLGFIAFKDIEINGNEYKIKSKTIRLNVNTSAWNKLLNCLILRYFPDYIYDIQYSNSKIARFSKQIADNWKLCIEYDKYSLNKSKRSRFFEFPHLNITLIKTNKGNNMSLPSNDIILLGVLGNPFFFYPAITPTAYFAYLESQYHKKSHYEIIDNESILCDYVATINEVASIENDGKKIFVKYRQTESKLIKHYVCYYIWLLSQTGRCYLKYIEKSIMSAIIMCNGS